MFLTRKVDWYSKMKEPHILRAASTVLDVAADELYRDIRSDIAKRASAPLSKDADSGSPAPDCKNAEDTGNEGGL